MSQEVTNIGVVGCGKISGIYLKNLQQFPATQVVACADLDPARAQTAAKEHNVPRACSVEELLADPDIEIVLNLTVPQAHYDVAKAALEAGKSTHGEKPLTLTREQGADLVRLAGEKNLRLGCAPDTFLGAGGQTCRKLVDDGWIGEPIGASAFFVCRGHERWHPDPEFYYRKGGGPVLDMMPYYLTALVNLIGPVSAVSSVTRRTFDQRVITSEKKNGQTIDVEVPTHVAGLLEFANGAPATILASFDVWGAQLPRIEIYGTEGTLSVPDPNNFGGPVRVMRAWTKEWQDVPLTHANAANSRGLGALDIACALRAERPHRANGDVARHVLDVMLALEEAPDQGGRVEIQSTCERPAAVPLGLRDGEMDD